MLLMTGRNKTDPTTKISKACHAIPPAVPKSITEIPRAPKVSNLPCPEKNKQNLIVNC